MVDFTQQEKETEKQEPLEVLLIAQELLIIVLGVLLQIQEITARTLEAILHRVAIMLQDHKFLHQEITKLPVV